jgi:hypothetical protein
VIQGLKAIFPEKIVLQHDAGAEKAALGIALLLPSETDHD